MNLLIDELEGEPPQQNFLNAEFPESRIFRISSQKIPARKATVRRFGGRKRRIRLGSGTSNGARAFLNIL